MFVSGRAGTPLCIHKNTPLDTRNWTKGFYTCPDVQTFEKSIYFPRHVHKLALHCQLFLCSRENFTCLLASLSHAHYRLWNSTRQSLMIWMRIWIQDIWHTGMSTSNKFDKTGCWFTNGGVMALAFKISKQSVLFQCHIINQIELLKLIIIGHRKSYCLYRARLQTSIGLIALHSKLYLRNKSLNISKFFIGINKAVSLRCHKI